MGLLLLAVEKTCFMERQRYIRIYEQIKEGVKIKRRNYQYVFRE